LYCLSYNDTGGCLNKKYENAPKAVGSDFVQYVDYVYVKDSVNFKFLAILESDDKQKEQSAQFRNVVITSYNVLQNISLAPDNKAYSIGKTINTNSDAEIVLPDYSNLNQDYLPRNYAYNRKPKNCDNFNETSFDRKYSLDKYTYEAEDAISCDSVDTANINTRSSYLVDFVYRNIEGKGLDVCFASGVLQKCMLQDRLMTLEGRFYDVGNVKIESFILPSYPEASKIQINIGNQSIGHIKTVNELYSINTKYIPYKWLKGVYTGSLKAINNNKLKVLSVKKIHTYKYEVTTNNQKGLLVLNQSFDNGWVMYNSNSCLFGLTTPLTCFHKVKDHRLISNWANGWMVSDSNNLSARYVILFWPQYMQFAGYLILVAWIFILLVLVWKKRINN